MSIKSSVYWRDVEKVECTAPLEGDKTYDVCIVGAGYTGLWTAHFLKQAAPSLRIALAEARYTGAGASGHNDGFVLKALGGHGASSLEAKYGHDEMEHISQALRNSVLELTRFCIAENLDVQFEASVIYSVATVNSHRRKINAHLQMGTKLGFQDEKPLDDKEINELFGSARVLAGHRVGGGLINPFRLARELARVVVDSGVHLYEKTPVTGIEETASGVSAVCEGGRVLCDKVVLATDAFQSWYAPLARQSSCVRSYILVSEPLTRAQLERLNWVRRPCFIDVHEHSLFGRLTWDNRILLGGGFGAVTRRADDNASPREQERAERHMTGLFRYLFPALHDVRPEYVYGGVIGMSRDMLPHIGPLSSRVSYASGYSGHGIVATHLAAKALRDITLQTRSDALTLPFVQADPPSEHIRMPPVRAWAQKARHRAADWASDRPVRAELRRLGSH